MKGIIGLLKIIKTLNLVCHETFDNFKIKSLPVSGGLLSFSAGYRLHPRYNTHSSYMCFFVKDCPISESERVQCQFQEMLYKNIC